MATLTQTSTHLTVELLWKLAHTRADWQELTPKEQALFSFYSATTNYQTPQEAFQALKNRPVAPQKDPQDLESVEIDSQKSVVIDQALLKSLILQKQLDEDRLRQQVSNQRPDLTQKQIATLLEIYRLKQAAKLAISSPKEMAPEITATQPKPENDPHNTLYAQAKIIAETAIASTNIPYTPTQKEQVIEQIIIGSADLETNPDILPVIIQVALASNPTYQSPEALLFRQLDTVTAPLQLDKDLDSADTIINSDQQTVTDLKQLSFPSDLVLTTSSKRLQAQLTSLNPDIIDTATSLSQ